MSETIKPTETGGCSGDDCPEYDGKRCRLTGFRPSVGCEPEVARLRAEVERYAHSMEVATEDVNKAEAEVERLTAAHARALADRDAALRERDRLRNRIAAVEWCFREQAPNSLRYCPECKSAEPHHGDRCQLAAFLAADPKEGAK